MLEAQLMNGARLQPKNFQAVLPSLGYFNNAIFVHHSGSDTANSGTSPDKPVATLAQAATLSTASVDDVIIVLPGHAETVTSAITLSKAGVRVIGLGEGMRRPSITGNGTIDAINITGANVTLENFQFPVPGTDDQTADINIAAAGVTVRNTHHLGSTTSKNKTDIITVTAAGDDFVIEGTRMYNTVVDCVSAISVEGACARGIIRNNTIQGQFSTAVLMDEATATLLTIENNLFKNTKAATAVVTFTTGNSTGVMRFNHLSGRHTTIASNLVAGTGMDFFENRVVEEAALNGMILPVADAD